MLNDPLVLNSGSVYAAPTGGVAASYGRTAISRGGYTVYNCASGAYSADQQSRLMIRSRPVIGGASSSEVRLERDKNVAAINGVPQKDSTARVRILVEGDMQHFTVADILALLANAFEVYRTNSDAIIANGQS